MAEIDREKYASIGFVVKGGASPSRGPAEGKPRWRNRVGSKYRGASVEEVKERARELASMPGLKQVEIEQGIRELSMYESTPGRAFELFGAGVMAAHEEQKKQIDVTVTNEAEEADDNG